MPGDAIITSSNPLSSLAPHSLKLVRALIPAPAAPLDRAPVFGTGRSGLIPWRRHYQAPNTKGNAFYVCHLSQLCLRRDPPTLCIYPECASSRGAEGPSVGGAGSIE